MPKKRANPAKVQLTTKLMSGAVVKETAAACQLAWAYACPIANCSSPSARRLAIYSLAQRNRGQFLVCRLFLIEVGGEQPQDVVVPELLGPGNQRPITGDFVMLHRLCGADDRGIEHLFVRDLCGDLVGFGD